MTKKRITRIGLSLIILFCAYIFSPNVSFAQEQYSIKPDFSYDKSEFIENYFFPPEKAKWDGYEVLNSDWKLLDIHQKQKFVSEALKEIEMKEKVKVVFAGPKSELVGLLEGLTGTLDAFWVKQPVITLLIKSLWRERFIKGEIVTSAQNKPFITMKILDEMNEENPTVEVGKRYIGYISCFKKDDAWLPDSEGPVVGEVKRRFFFEKRIITPSGSTLLTRNYPLNFEYKIIAFREINSFVDDNALTNYYYKVIFEPIRRIDLTN